MSYSKSALIITVCTGVLCLVIGILIGYFGKKAAVTEAASSTSMPLITEADEAMSSKLIEAINKENIRRNLKLMASKPHLAGTPQDKKLAEQIAKIWRRSGLDWVKLTPYTVLLSYPETKLTDRNRVRILDKDTRLELFSSQVEEPPLSSQQDFSNVVPPFNAYSASGTLEAELVYVNYGRIEDFEYLINNGYKVNGTIVIARYGKIYRGDKVKFAERYGALGVILYSDPADSTDKDSNVGVFPDTWWMPGAAVQRGTVLGGKGDPLTPGYPANDAAHRLNISDAKLPKIPVHPIGYNDAYKILSRMKGRNDAPLEWNGAMNFTYKIYDPSVQWLVQLIVGNFKESKESYNVIGAIRGAVEPDRYVLVGNHRDAWVFGAVDPSSGTSVVLEIVRVLGKMTKEGWRPRRTILFCSWGAEEFGLLGSYEWVEDHWKTLYDRAVAYINIDIAVEGNHTLRAAALPTLYNTLYEATKKVPQPEETQIKKGSATMYEQWVRTTPKDKDAEPHRIKPKINDLGSGSDFAAFAYIVGVPCVDIRYTYDHDKYDQLSLYPLYHSAHDNVFLLDKIVDPTFKHHRAIGQLGVEMARNLADSLIIPYDIMSLAVVLEKSFDDLMNVSEADMLKNGIKKEKLTTMSAAIKKFKATAENFTKHMVAIDTNDPFAIRRINDQLMALERGFIDPNGLPDRPNDRHLVFAPSAHDAYSGSRFPGIGDVLYEINHTDDQAVKSQLQTELSRQVSAVIHCIHAAEYVIKENADIL